MIRRFGPALFMALVVIFSACTEQLDMTGTCPGVCPGESVEFRDTVLFAEPGGDTTYSGYPTFRTATSLLLASGGEYGQARALMRFFPRGDSLLTDSNRAIIRIDSIFLELVPEMWDPSVTGQKLEVYRLPTDVDTSLTVAELDQLMTPQSFLRAIDIEGEPAPTPHFLLFTGSELEKFAFEPGEPTELAIGLRLVSDFPTALRIGAAPSGGASPSWTTWGTVAVGDDSTTDAAAQRPVRDNLSIVEPPEYPENALIVGGLPARKSFVTFSLPPFLRDSAVIIRATLRLSLADFVTGIPGDSTAVNVETLLADLGAKSPVTGQALIGSFVHTGQQGGISFDVVPLVRTWQGQLGLPNIFRISSGADGSSYTVPAFISTRQGTGMPTLRITWRPLFKYPGF